MKHSPTITLNKIINHKYFLPLYLVILSVLYFVRLFQLDADGRFAWLMTGIMGDEIYYNELAINIYNLGFGGLSSGLCGDVTLANCKNYLLPNLLTGFSFDIFGLNLYGLRVPYVFLGFLSLLLLFYCSKKCFLKYPILTFGIPLIFVIDFGVLLISRYAVTVIPCMFMVISYVAGYLALRDYNNIRNIFLGFWPIVAFCCVYNYMAFLILAGLIIFVLGCGSAVQIKDKVKFFVYYASGNILALVVCNLLSWIVFHENIFSIFVDVFSAHSSKITLATSTLLSSIITYVYNFLSYIISNSFRYDFFVLVLFVLALILFVYVFISSLGKKEQIKKCLHSNSSVFLILILTHWLQIVFLNNLTVSKGLITFPCVLLFIGCGISLWKENAAKILCGKYKWLALSVIILVVISCFVGVFLVLSRFTHLLVSEICVIMSGNFLVLLFIMYFIFKISNKWLILAFLVSLLILSFLSFTYVYSDNTFKDKEICMDIYSVIGDTPVVGGHSKMFYLYDGNNINVLVGEYDHYRGKGYDMNYVYGVINESVWIYDSLYFLGYAPGIGMKEMDIEYINEMVLLDTPYKFEQIQTYERRIAGYDNDSLDYAIYKKVLKDGVFHDTSLIYVK